MTAGQHPVVIGGYLAAASGSGASGLGAAWLTAAVALATAVGALLLFAARRLWRVLARIRDFLDDWFGEAARPGVPERAGVMARLQSAEGLITRVLAETTPNGGGTMRDVMNKISADVTSVMDEQADLRGALEAHTRQHGKAP